VAAHCVDHISHSRTHNTQGAHVGMQVRSPYQVSVKDESYPPPRFL